MGRYLSRVSKEILQRPPYADSSKQLILIVIYYYLLNKLKVVLLSYFV